MLLKEAKSNVNSVNALENSKPSSRANPKGTKVSCSVPINLRRSLEERPIRSAVACTNSSASPVSSLKTALNFACVSSASLAVFTNSLPNSVSGAVTPSVNAWPVLFKPLDKFLN